MTTMVIYMRSGNKIKLRGVKEWSVTNAGNKVNRLHIVRTSWAGLFTQRLVVSTIDLSQIEAVTVGGLF